MSLVKNGIQRVLLTSAFAGGLALLIACPASEQRVDIEQPIEFDHKTHIDFFRQGDHKKAMTDWHANTAKWADDEIDKEFVEGNCIECHEDQRELKACALCHPAPKGKEARRNDWLRSCIGCHRTVWTGFQASIPTIVMCTVCHKQDKEALKGRDGKSVSQKEGILRKYREKGEGIPWIQINTLPEHVHFSHSSHVRLASMDCDECHQDMTKRTEPPDKVHVFTMDRCIACHKRRGASTDCLTCHK